MTRPRIGLIVVAAGRGERMGGIDKVWEPIGPHPAVVHALQRLSPAAGRIVVVVRHDLQDGAIDRLGAQFRGLRVVAGGIERQDSVRKGLDALSNVDVVAIHDAARPFPPRALVDDGVALLVQYDVALPVLPITDTVKRVGDNNEIFDTLDRSHLRAAQTPQLFRFASLVGAHASGTGGATDDAVLVERAGGKVAAFPGSPQNFKITTPFDLAVARLLVQHGALI